MTVFDPGYVWVEGGKIRAVGSGLPEGPFEGVEIVDVGGDLLMPGMVNPHSHLAMTMFRGLGEDVDDRLFRYILPLERSMVSPQMVRLGTRLAALELIQGGVTTVADMYYFETEVGRVLVESGLRGVVGQTLADFNAPDQDGIDEGFARVEELREMFKGHPLVTPSIAPHAPYSTGLETMRRVANYAEKTGLPVQMHLAETDGEMDWCQQNYGTRPVELVARAGLLREGLIAAHCLHVNTEEIPVMAKAGVRVAHNARANGKAGRGIAPIHAMRQAGITVGIATDGPMSGNTLDLFSQFAAVVQFQRILAHTRSVMQAPEIVRMATIEGAKVLGLEGVTGSLEVGKQADLIRLDLSAPRLHPIYDPYSALVYAAMPSDVRDVMVDGRWLMRERQVQTLEPAKVLADALGLAKQFKAEVQRIDGNIRQGEGLGA
jgi:5-methylthioadenosine/S-adenosylhomocysteine deaminase